MSPFAKEPLSKWKQEFSVLVSPEDDFCCFSVTQSRPTLCYPMDRSTPGFPVLHYLPECAQAHVHWVSDAIQPSHPLSPPSPPALNLSQHQSLLQWISSLHQVAKVLELQLQHQFFPWILRVMITVPLTAFSEFADSEHSDSWTHTAAAYTILQDSTYLLLVQQVNIHRRKIFLSFPPPFDS